MELSTIIWMFLVLKIPLLAALWLIWYAVQAPETAGGDSEERGGGSDRAPGTRPRGPRPPRRGPHATPPPSPSRRVRTSAGRRARHAPR